MIDEDLMPVVAVRLAEGRSGSTLLMQLLATSPQIVFDDRYPSEYRFLSYFARMATMMTEPFDEHRHVGVTPFFFGPEPVWGPVPFDSDVIDIGRAGPTLLRGLWAGWSTETRTLHPAAKYYAEKLAVDIDAVIDAGVLLRVIDLVRDPRDVLASIRSFTARGIDGFGRRAGVDEDEYLEHFIAVFDRGLREFAATPDEIDRIVVRYEDLAADVPATASRLGEWLGVELDGNVIAARSGEMRHHRTTASVQASIGRWRRDLSPEHAGRVAAELGPLLEPYGYRL